MVALLPHMEFVRANLWHVNISGCSASCKKRFFFIPPIVYNAALTLDVV